MAPSQAAAIARVMDDDSRIAYGLVFGSTGRGGAHAANRVFRDGVVLFARNRSAMVERRVRAILDYLDYRPFESAFVRGVLDARG